MLPHEFHRRAAELSEDGDLDDLTLSRSHSRSHSHTSEERDQSEPEPGSSPPTPGMNHERQQEMARMARFEASGNDETGQRVVSIGRVAARPRHRPAPLSHMLEERD